MKTFTQRLDPHRKEQIIKPQIKNRLTKYLTDEQVAAYEKYGDSFLAYLRAKSEDTRKALNETHEAFLETTNGKELGELVPLSFW